MAGPSSGEPGNAGCLLPAVAGLAASGAVVAVTARAWAACDVGVNATANAGTLLALAVALLVTNVLAALAARAAVRRLTSRPASVTVAAVGAVVAVSYVAIAVLATPAGYPDPICPGNVPPWWPWWLPG